MSDVGFQEVTIATPDDWHVHLRDDTMLRAVAPFTANLFRYALVMPNLSQPITTTASAAAYRERIIEAAGQDASAEFTPLMALYLNDSVSIADLRAGFSDGVVHAVKYYPAGATTNSEAGGSSLISYGPILSQIADLGIPLLVHAESTDPSVDIFDRERVFLENELAPVCEQLPTLKVTVEHVSTTDGVAFVREHSNVTGTITPHHLSCERSDILANGLRPDLYCKPVLNSKEDRQTLIEAATSGEASFFLGTDSAPHPLSSKRSAVGKAGIFSAPFALPILAEVFAERGALDRLEAFTSTNGARYHGFEPSVYRVCLRRLDDRSEVFDEMLRTNDGHEVQMFGVEAARKWSLELLQGSRLDA